jgi:hypothetical protein
MSTFLWAAFFILAIMVLMAVIVRSVSRMAHGPKGAPIHPSREPRRRPQHPPHA